MACDLLHAEKPAGFPVGLAGVLVLYAGLFESFVVDSRAVAPLVPRLPRELGDAPLKIGCVP